jgi:hypothetical protein
MRAQHNQRTAPDHAAENALQLLDHVSIAVRDRSTRLNPSHATALPGSPLLRKKTSHTGRLDD